MVFSSLAFLSVFLPVVFVAHLLIPGMRAKNALLIVASLVFYAYGEPVYVLLMAASALLNYGAGLLVGRSRAHAARRCALAAAVACNVGILVVFKYAGMLVGTLNFLTGLALPVPELALPIGISFFTFQALSYVIDVYRGNVAAQRSFARVLLYISFFPQLIAGPIVKYHDIDAQIIRRTVTPRNAARGLRRFCVGLGKKVLIANTVAVAVDALFDLPAGDLNVIAAWTAAVAYMVQIYFDFSGYSDMAIGLGRMFGFEFKENFNYPYKARSIQDFWRRWHISLSTWFKEYLYIPLGGNRCGVARTNFNKFTVFFLCGLWHGANWTFVVWGLIHGCFIVIENVLPVRKLPRAVGHVYAMLVVCLAFVIFRADTLGQGLGVIAQMFAGWDFSTRAMQVALSQLTPLFIATMCVGFVAALPVRDVLVRACERYASPRVRTWARCASYVLSVAVLVLCFASLSSGSYNPFIYFRF